VTPQAFGVNPSPRAPIVSTELDLLQGTLVSSCSDPDRGSDARIRVTLDSRDHGTSCRLRRRPLHRPAAWRSVHGSPRSGAFRNNRKARYYRLTAADGASCPADRAAFDLCKRRLPRPHTLRHGTRNAAALPVRYRSDSSGVERAVEDEFVSPRHDNEELGGGMTPDDPGEAGDGLATSAWFATG
jgi:hypothetical protein